MLYFAGLLAAALCAWFLAAPADGRAKLDPRLRLWLDDKPGAARRASRHEGDVAVLLHHRDRVTARHVTRGELERLLHDDGVRFIEAAPRLHLTNDLATARASARTGSLPAGPGAFNDEPFVATAGQTLTVSMHA